MPAPKLKDAEIQAALRDLPGWTLEKGMLQKSYKHPTFPEAIVFVSAVAQLAELANHHPDIDIRFNKVRLVLSTHSKGGLTELDFALAERIDTLSE